MNFDEKASGKLRESASTQHFTPVPAAAYRGTSVRIGWWLQPSSTLTSISWRQMGKERSCGLHSPCTRWRGEPGVCKSWGGSGTGTGKVMLNPSAVIQIGLGDAFPSDQADGKRCPSRALKREFALKYNLATPQTINSQGEAMRSTLVTAQEHFMLSLLSWYKPSI